MKGMRTLIKLARQELDVKRQQLSEVQAEKDELIRILAINKKELEQEKLAMGGMDNTTDYRFDTYLQRMKKEEALMHEAMAERDEAIEKMSDAIAEAYAEVKKYEIMLERHEKEIADKEKRREDAMLDELAIDGHMRKHSQGE